MAENRKEARGFVYGVLQSIGGSVMLSMGTAIWDKVKHGSIDWLGIGGLFVLALIVFFLLFWFFWRRLPAISPPKATQGVVGGTSSRLKILWAHYGAENGPMKEVGDEYLRPRICGNCLVGWVGSDLFGPLDPAIGLQKHLRVRYSFDDKEVTITRPEHALLVLPEDKFLKDQVEECRRERELEKNQFNSDLWRAQKSYSQCEEERRAVKAKLEPLTTLQLDAIELANDLRKFVVGLGKRPSVDSSQFPGDVESHLREVHRVEDPWDERAKALYIESGLDKRVESLRNRFVIEGFLYNDLNISIEGLSTARVNILKIASELWNLSCKLGEKGISVEDTSVRGRLEGNEKGRI